MTRRDTKRQVFTRSAGIALVAVLWSVVLLTLIASMVLGIQRTQSHVARRFADSALAEVAADSALNLTLLRIGTRAPAAAAGQGPSELRAPTFLQKISVSVERERDRVDLNTAGPATLTACFLNSGLSPDEARSMASRIIDWRDTDDVAGEGGAEEADYHAAGLHYRPRNGPFQSVEEVRQILGMDSVRTSTLRQFTVYTHQSDDLNTGDGGDGFLTSPASSGPRCGGARGPGGASPSPGGPASLIGEVVRVRACSSDRSRVCRLVVARLTGSVQNPFQIFVWKTEASDAD